MLENSNNTVEKVMTDVSIVVKDHFSKLIFEMNKENKCMQSTIDYIKNMPIVIKLQEELKEAKKEIEYLKEALSKYEKPSIKLKMQELTKNISETNYDEITKLVSEKVNEKEKESINLDINNDFLSMYLNNQDTDEDEDEEDQSDEHKTPITMPEGCVIGISNLNLDGAECKQALEEQELSDDEDNTEECDKVVEEEEDYIKNL